jgi:hypothetical protein
MKFVDYFPVNDNVVNMFKEIDFGDDILKSPDYTLYKPLETDNLMTISFKHYRNVDDWWVIYFFNNISDVTFSIINNNVINDTIDYYIGLVQDYDNISERLQNSIFEIVLQFFLSTNDFEEAVALTNNQLSTEENRNNVNFINDFKMSILEYVIEKTGVGDSIKIPDLSLVFKMKTIMNNKSIVWAEN